MKGSRSTIRGHSLVELLVVVAIVGLTAAIALPAFFDIRKRAAVGSASRELRMIFDSVRSRAITQGRNSALKFRFERGQWVYSIYDDGDWDGVRNDDIASGIDRQVSPSRPVLQVEAAARIGLPLSAVTDPDSRRLLIAGEASPVRFNSSTICSFSPEGDCTPGSIFLTDGLDHAAMVRVSGSTGRIRLLLFNRSTGRWDE